jgi:hypothetical protein
MQPVDEARCPHQTARTLIYARADEQEPHQTLAWSFALLFLALFACAPKKEDGGKTSKSSTKASSSAGGRRQIEG